MAYAQIHTQALSHPKVLALSAPAFRVWVAGLCYAQEHLTDGQIPRGALVALRVPAPKQAVGDLVRVRLWEATADGWQIHDYATWNRTRADVETKRARDRDRMRESRTSRPRVAHESPASRARVAHESPASRGDVASPPPHTPPPTHTHTRERDKDLSSPRDERRAGAWLENFPARYFAARQVAYPQNLRRDYPNAVQLAQAVPDDAHLDALTDLFLRAQHRDLTDQTRTPGRMLAMLPALEEHLRAHTPRPPRRTA
jgi:hypothetical protein